MGKWLRGVVWLVAFWMLAQNLALWGGLALTPVIGKQLREQASVQSPLAATYLFLGRHVLPPLGLEAWAVRRVGVRFEPQTPTPTALPPPWSRGSWPRNRPANGSTTSARPCYWC